MKPSTRLAVRLLQPRPVPIPTTTTSSSSPSSSSSRTPPSSALLARTNPGQSHCSRQIHTTTSAPAVVQPAYGAGPPPEPPVPTAEHPDSRIARRRKQAELLRRAKEIRASSKAASRYASASTTTTPGAERQSLLRKRFWQEVHVREVDDAYEIHLDARPLRHPTTKAVVRIPPTKPHLAHALAVEWDMLVSAQQATRQHLVPLTSLVCRAIDIAEDDENTTTAHTSSSASANSIRSSIATVLLRYFDTDSLLCWAPPPGRHEHDDGAAGGENGNGDGDRAPRSLRELQERTAGEVVGVLTSEVWPGVEIGPVLDGETIMPRGQAPGVREVVQGWIMGLEPWELAGLERAALAGKGVLGAARLVFEWSEGGAGRRAAAASAGVPLASTSSGASPKFGVEEAARAASLEVSWQTGRWGEVEDTHDVEKEDLRRQLGSVVLLVSGKWT